MLKLALIGKDIQHSQSGKIYQELMKRDCSYALLDFETKKMIPRIDILLSLYDGVNITSPYKRHFINELILTPEAKAVGAINCMTKNEKGELIGTNTDLLAVKSLLQKEFPCTGIILGGGVMAVVVEQVFSEFKQRYVLLKRATHGDLSQIDLTTIKSDLIVNCCDREFLFEGKFQAGSKYWNLNYGQSGQQQLIERQKGLYQDGEELLRLQAKFALKFWEESY